MSRAVLSLGSNLGDRVAHLRGAVHALRDWVVAISGVYETEPWGDEDQPLYLNAVMIVTDPDATPRDWLARAQSAEAAQGRTRDPARPFGPRTLDVDVIAVYAEDGTPIGSADADLTLPHPRAHLRAFVLRPWIDVEPYARLPDGWVTDLLTRDDAAATVHPRPDITLESGQ